MWYFDEEKGKVFWAGMEARDVEMNTASERRNSVLSQAICLTAGEMTTANGRLKVALLVHPEYPDQDPHSAEQQFAFDTRSGRLKWVPNAGDSADIVLDVSQDSDGEHD